MLADALCLWIAVVLSAPGVARVANAVGPDSDAGVSDANQESSAMVAGLRDGWAGQHDRKGPSLALSASPKSLLLYGSARVTRSCRAGHLTRSVRQDSRSLSYLSLTLRCMAPHTGWLGGCAPLHAVRDKKNTVDTSARPTGKTYGVCKNGWAKHLSVPSPISRIRPVFL
jgi:hypothetical protein